MLPRNRNSRPVVRDALTAARCARVAGRFPAKPIVRPLGVLDVEAYVEQIPAQGQPSALTALSVFSGVMAGGAFEVHAIDEDATRRPMAPGRAQIDGHSAPLRNQTTSLVTMANMAGFYTTAATSAAAAETNGGSHVSMAETLMVRMRGASLDLARVRGYFVGAVESDFGPALLAVTAEVHAQETGVVARLGLGDLDFIAHLGRQSPLVAPVSSAADRAADAWGVGRSQLIA